MKATTTTSVCFRLAVATVFSFVLGLSTSSNAADISDLCTIKSTSQRVAILVCATETSQDQWREAGQLACESKQLCNAWIWLDDKLAPQKAPETDADLPKNKSGQAAAIWITDAQSLILVKPAKQ